MMAEKFDSRRWGGSESGSLTIRGVLFDADPRDAVPNGGSPALSEILSKVRVGMRPVVERELAAALAGLLDVDVSEALLAGWRAHSDLLAAAKATSGDPGAAEVVALATHRIESSYHPQVELIVNGVKAATVELTVEVAVDIEGLLVTVRGGRLVTLHSGRCQIRVTLLYSEVRLASGTATFDAPGTVALGAGMDLLERRQPMTSGR